MLFFSWKNIVPHQFQSALSQKRWSSSKRVNLTLGSGFWCEEWSVKLFPRLDYGIYLQVRIYWTFVRFVYVWCVIRPGRNCRVMAAFCLLAITTSSWGLCNNSDLNMRNRLNCCKRVASRGIGDERKCHLSSMFFRAVVAIYTIDIIRSNMYLVHVCVFHSYPKCTFFWLSRAHLCLSLAASLLVSPKNPTRFMPPYNLKFQFWIGVCLAHPPDSTKEICYGDSVTEIPTQSVTEILLRRFCDRNSHTL